MDNTWVYLLVNLYVINDSFVFISPFNDYLCGYREYISVSWAFTSPLMWTNVWKKLKSQTPHQYLCKVPLLIGCRKPKKVIFMGKKNINHVAHIRDPNQKSLLSFFWLSFVEFMILEYAGNCKCEIFKISRNKKGHAQ